MKFICLYCFRVNFLLPVVVLALMGGLIGSSSVFAGDVKHGEMSFKRYCAACHGLSGKGDGPVAESLKVKPADLTQLSQRHQGTFPREFVIKKIDGRLMPRSHGPSEMPVWGEWFAIQALADGVLQEDLEGIETEVAKRLEGLVAYLKTLQD